MVIKFTTDIEIGDEVYHVTPESQLGIVLDISYSLLFQAVKYYVTFGIKDTDWYLRSELLTEKRII